MIVAYLLAALFFGYSLHIDQPLLFLVSLLLSVFAFISFGLTIAPIFVMYREVQQWQNAMEYPIYILAGFLFPILLLPGWTTPISYLLPPYWAAVALHGTSTTNAPIEQTLFAWGMMLVFSIIDSVHRQPLVQNHALQSACGCDAGCAMKTLTSNLRLFWQGTILSYAALFAWLRPVTYTGVQDCHAADADAVLHLSGTVSPQARTMRIST